VIDELSRRLREKDLRTVARSCDACSTVDVDADVTLVGQGRLAGVDSDASTDRALDRERSLRITAAARASDAFSKATKKASPCVSTSTPPWPSNVARSRRRCSASASA